MSKIDKIKEQIGRFKVVFGLLFATDISLVAYLFTKIDTLSVIQMVLVLIGLILITLATFYIHKNATNKIDSLEGL